MLITISQYEYKEIAKKGKIVNVVIEEVPERCQKTTTRSVLLVFFKHKGETFSRKVTEKWCERIKKGNSLQMKSNENESKFIFTWETENKFNDNLILWLLLTLLGLFSIYKGFSDRHKKEKRKQ